MFVEIKQNDRCQFCKMWNAIPQRDLTDWDKFQIRMHLATDHGWMHPKEIEQLV